jgi:uncharacterized membrane protein YfcA
MSSGTLAVLATLGVLTLAFTAYWIAAIRRWRAEGGVPEAEQGVVPSPAETFVGFVTNFFDTLGIGSFATTASILKVFGMVADEKIPGTLNVGHTLPTFVQAVIFIAIVAVEPRTLILMLAAAALGAWLGAGVVAGLPRRKVQIGMGTALLVAAGLLLRSNLDISTAGGTALGLDGTRLAVAFAGNLVLGAMMTIGVGLYAPCMILVSLLGMDPKVAFPIMMGSCAILMPVASVRFIRERRFAERPSVGLALGGVPGVLIAAYAVGSMNVKTVRWLVIVVVVYTAGAMLLSAAREARRR